MDVAAPEPREECRTVSTELTEVVCKDVSREVCVDLAKYVEATDTAERTEAILGEPVKKWDIIGILFGFCGMLMLV